MKNPLPFGLHAAIMRIFELGAIKCILLRFLPVVANVHYSKQILYGGHTYRDGGFSLIVLRYVQFTIRSWGATSSLYPY